MEKSFVDLGPGTVTVVFGVGKGRYEKQCHSFPLAARSPVLRTALTANMLERATGRIEIPDISAAAGKELLFYCYTGHVRPTAFAQVTFATKFLMFVASIAGPDPHSFGRLDPDPLGNTDPDSDPGEPK